eukprot:862714-Amphidinium_carterae.1
MDTLLNAGGVALSVEKGRSPNLTIGLSSNNSDEAMLVKAILQGEGGFQACDQQIEKLRELLAVRA